MKTIIYYGRHLSSMAFADRLAAAMKITVERRGGICLIGLNGPEVHNRIDPEAFSALSWADATYGSDDDLRAAVLLDTARTSPAASMSTLSPRPWGPVRCARPTPTVSTRWGGRPDVVLHRVHICGPTPTMDAVKAVLLDLGVAGGRIRMEAFGTDRRDPTKKAGRFGTVVGKGTFLDSRKAAPAREGATLLDVADGVKVRIDSACRSKTYGTGMVKLRAGQVHMSAQDALSDHDSEDGDILACQAEPVGDAVSEASPVQLKSSCR